MESIPAAFDVNATICRQQNAACRSTPCELSLLKRLAKLRGRHAGHFAKPLGEMALVEEAGAQRDFRQRLIGRRQQAAGLLQPKREQILGRRHPQQALKQAMNVRGR